MTQTKPLKFAALAFITTGLLLLLAALPAPQSFSNNSTHSIGRATVEQLGIQPAIAQQPRAAEAWRRVYEVIPELPLENQYISSETGQVAVNNTLASRLIRYHTFIKGRPANYRFDWKLTLADYLGINERINEGTYPGSDTLRTNPLRGDRAVISQLNRTQRNQLVDVLVSIFSTADETATPTVTPAPIPRPSPQPSAPPHPVTPVQPRPGDAQLLLP